VSYPALTGDAFTLTGTISSTTQLTAPPTTAPQTDAGTVALTTRFGASTTAGSTVSITSTSNEVDTYPRETITTNTTTVNDYTTAAGKTAISVVSTNATDSNGVQYINTYGTGNGLLDVLPETTGAFGPNNAALTYQENDPGNYSRNRVIQADGSYTETGMDPFGDVQTIITNSDLSASYDASQYSGRIFAFTKPTGAPAMITITYTHAPSAPVQITITSWIPATATQPETETDTNAGNTAFPAGCAVPAKYGTSGNQLVQSITRVDPALGNLETETITSYVVPNYGPICTVMADHVSTFYDFTGQFGYGLFYSITGLPVETTDVAETLTMASITTSAGTLAEKRQTDSVSRTNATPFAFARSRFEEKVREKLKSRNITFSRDFFASGAHAK